MKDLTPEQFAKLQALNSWTQNDLSRDELDRLKELNPKENQYVGEKDKELEEIKDKQNNHPMMQKMLFQRILRQMDKNPEHLDDLYNTMKLKQEALDRIK